MNRRAVSAPILAALAALLATPGVLATPFPTAGGSYAANVVRRLDQNGNLLATLTPLRIGVSDQFPGSSVNIADGGHADWAMGGGFDAGDAAVMNIALDKTYNLNKIVIYYGDFRPAMHEVRVSLDGVSWTAVLPAQGGIGATHTITFAAQDVHYIEWEVLGPGSSGYVYLKELTAFVADTAVDVPQLEDGYNIATTSLVSDLGGWISWAPPAAITDGNPHSYAIRNVEGSPAAALYDLGAALTLYRVELSFAYGQNWAGGGLIELSADQLTWTVVLDQTTPLSNSAHVVTPTAARYVRLTNYGVGGGALSEMLVYALDPAAGNTPPTAVCQDLSVVLGPGGASITPSDIDNGSSDPDLGDTITLSLSQDTFGFGDLGDNTVTLFVDDGDVVSDCDATVSVVLSEPFPSSGGSYTANVVRRLDAAGNLLATLTPIRIGVNDQFAGSWVNIADGGHADWAMGGGFDAGDAAIMNIELDKTYSLNKIVAFYGDFRPAMHEVRVSLDEVTWTTVLPLQSGVGATHTISFPAQDVRFIEWEVHGPGNSGYVYLKDLMAFVADTAVDVPQQQDGYNIAPLAAVTDLGGWISWAPPTAITDGNPHSYAIRETEGVPATAIYDLGDVVTLYRIELSFAYGQNWAGGGKLEISANQGLWNTVWDQFTPLSNSAYPIAPESARYVRLTNYGTGGGALSEMLVYAQVAVHVAGTCAELQDSVHGAVCAASATSRDQLLGLIDAAIADFLNGGTTSDQTPEDCRAALLLTVGLAP